MALLETDDQLTIVNRSLEYRINKKLIRKVPYFEKMLNLGLKESKENKVELDFDEKAFKRFLNWIQIGCIFIEMDFVVNLCNMADYFGLSDCLIDDCFTYLHHNFSIKHLPVIIPQVTSTSKLINSGTLNAFICRYFTKIVNTPVWLNYPVETIKYICALDLMIHSEYQVFDVIMRWATFKADSRKSYLKELLKLVRYCHLEEKDLSKIQENEFFRSSCLEPELCSRKKANCNCNIDRTKQGCFVVIEELSDKNLRLKVFDSDFSSLVNQVMQPDESMPLFILHNEHISDISFDSGRKMIRIDWKQNTYRLFDFSAYKSYHRIIHRCIHDAQQASGECHVRIDKCEMSEYEYSFLEVNEKFILVGNESAYFNCWKNPSTGDINKLSDDNRHTYLTTILDNRIYMLTHNFEFFQFNIDSDLEFKKIKLESFKENLQFDNLLLTSKQVNDDRVLLIDKTTKDVLCFNVNTQEWSSIGRIIDCKGKPTDGQKESNVLKTFTFGFVSTDSINLCLERNLNAVK
ncbi:uncharacterized protein LOC112539775 [Tetranychus urticae]|uniref:uncharacterized protein LOC112539775 n=1 Tax=Tetranychus urticae TaxID=32264 RepID=UPI000D651E59|nr:uncharacterized protein LOC112539775 [Tetranychus urticae]